MIHPRRTFLAWLTTLSAAALTKARILNFRASDPLVRKGRSFSSHPPQPNSRRHPRELPLRPSRPIPDHRGRRLRNEARRRAVHPGSRGSHFQCPALLPGARNHGGRSEAAPDRRPACLFQGQNSRHPGSQRRRRPQYAGGEIGTPRLRHGQPAASSIRSRQPQLSPADLHAFRFRSGDKTRRAQSADVAPQTIATAAGSIDRKIISRITRCPQPNGIATSFRDCSSRASRQSYVRRIDAGEFSRGRPALSVGDSVDRLLGCIRRASRPCP